MTGKPLDLVAAETLVEVYRTERDEARAMVAGLAHALRRTLWHDLGCASMCSDDAECDCEARPQKGDEHVMEPLLAAERMVAFWEQHMALVGLPADNPSPDSEAR